jgi:transposase
MFGFADKLRRQWTNAQRNYATHKDAPADRAVGGSAERKQKRKVARSLYRKWRRYLRKVTRRVRALHEQTAAWLLKNYRVVLVPNMNTGQMVRRQRGRWLHPTVRRGMLLAHYRFRHVLLSMARRSPHCRVTEVREDFTSKTCGMCGVLDEDLGSRKTFRCPHDGCEFVCDRDVNGARNILPKYLHDKGIIW